MPIRHSFNLEVAPLQGLVSRHSLSAIATPDPLFSSIAATVELYHRFAPTVAIEYGTRRLEGDDIYCSGKPLARLEVLSFPVPGTQKLRKH